MLEKIKIDRLRDGRGLFIVFCGLDGSGKSTVMDLVIKEIEKESTPIVTGKHPPDEWIQNHDIVDKYVMNNSDNIEDIDEIEYSYKLRKKYEQSILSTLKQGKYVFYHRYIFSLMSYHAGARRVDMQYIRNLTGDLLKPDIVFFMNISLDTFYKRAEKHGILNFQKDRKFVERMALYYKLLAKEFGWIVVDTDNMTCNQSADLCISYIKNYKIDDFCYDLRGNKFEL